MTVTKPASLPVAWITIVIFAAGFVTQRWFTSGGYVAFENDTSTTAPVSPDCGRSLAKWESPNAERLHSDRRAPLVAVQQRIERGKRISSRVTAKELYAVYTQIKSEYNEKAFCHDDNPFASSRLSSSNHRSACVDTTQKLEWEVLKQTSDGIQISIMTHPSDPTCPYVRFRAIMPGTVASVWNFLRLENWDSTMPKVDPFYEGLAVLGEYKYGGVAMTLARKRSKRIVGFGKRDFTFVSVSDIPTKDGVWVSGTVSVSTDKLPRESGYTRAFQDSVAFYEPLDDENGESRTALTIVCRIDLNDSGEGGEGGSIPMWLYVKTLGASGVVSMASMRKELALKLDEERRNKTQEVLSRLSSHGGKSDSDWIRRGHNPVVPWMSYHRLS